MTEIFKCRKAGTKCCAPKSLIREALGHIDPEPHPEDTVHDPVIRPFNTTPSHTITEYAPTSKFRLRFYVLRL